MGKWVKKDMPVVPSLEEHPPSQAKRLTRIHLGHLIMHRKMWIQEKMSELGINTPQKAIEFVIKEIDYPITRGKPDDKHVFNFFSGKACWKIEVDYWATADEVLTTYILNKKVYGRKGYGDCEDSAILCVALLRILKVPAYVVFGVVKRDNIILGGHGWAIAKLPEDGEWHLIECTLNDPLPYPYGYPEIDPETNTWKVGKLVYEGWIKFTETRYYEWEESSMNRFADYLALDSKSKERKKKYDEISLAWNTETKNKKHESMLTRLRWRE